MFAYSLFAFTALVDHLCDLFCIHFFYCAFNACSSQKLAVRSKAMILHLLLLHCLRVVAVVVVVAVVAVGNQLELEWLEKITHEGCGHNFAIFAIRLRCYLQHCVLARVLLLHMRVAKRGLSAYFLGCCLLTFATFSHAWVFTAWSLLCLGKIRDFLFESPVCLQFTHHFVRVAVESGLFLFNIVYVVGDFLKLLLDSIHSNFNVIKHRDCLKSVQTQ